MKFVSNLANFEEDLGEEIWRQQYQVTSPFLSEQAGFAAFLLPPNFTGYKKAPRDFNHEGLGITKCVELLFSPHRWRRVGRSHSNLPGWLCLL